MNVAPLSTFEAVIDDGTTGLAGTIRLSIIDNAGGTFAAATAEGIIEVAFGIYSKPDNVAPGSQGQYTLIWDDGTDDGILGVEDLVVTFNAPGDVPTGDTYATTDELARILKIRTPSEEQTVAMTRVLLSATGEINSEIDLPDGDTLGGWQLALATEVNLERAVEHWQQMESPFGIIGLGDAASVYTARDSWDRHAHKLAVLKQQWGLA